MAAQVNYLADSAPGIFRSFGICAARTDTMALACRKRNLRLSNHAQFVQLSGIILDGSASVYDPPDPNLMAESARNPKTAIAPMLSVRRGASAVEFYKAAFGAAELFRIDDESGAVVARLSVGDAEFWVADESPENQNFSPESLGGGTVRMVMIVEDPDAAFAQAVAAGASVVWPVTNQYGWRLGRIVDPFGHHWEIGKPLPEAS